MSNQQPSPFDLLLEQIRQVIREEIAASTKPRELLTPEELASKLKVDVSWIYERSRLGKLPTHRVGRYIRFDLAEVLESQRAKGDQ